MNRYLRFFSNIALSALVLLQAGFLFAAPVEVTLRNGNLITSFYDLQYKGGMDPSILRTYNSKANYKGIFGWGWGSEYESYITFGADGTLVLREFGGGADNRFVPVNSSHNELNQAIQQIVDALVKYKLRGNDAQFED